MNQYKARWELKNLAKDKLLGKFGSVILLVITAGILSRILTASISRMIIPTNLLVFVIKSLVMTIPSTIAFTLNIGIYFYNLNLTCNQPHFIGNLFYPLQSNPRKSIELAFVFTLVSTLCNLPSNIAATYLLQNLKDVQLWFITFLLLLIGSAVYIIFLLHYSQSLYLFFDFPELSTKELLRKSRKLMKGNKKRLLLLELSFIPLHLACILTFNIGYLWLTPYNNVTKTYFFLDLMNPVQKEASAE